MYDVDMYSALERLITNFRVFDYKNEKRVDIKKIK